MPGHVSVKVNENSDYSSVIAPVPYCWYNPKQQIPWLEASQP